MFPDDVMQWAAEAIEGTAHAAYFTRGKPTSGWYQGWLRRMEFLTCHLRPLEQTRAEWYTAENLDTYFEVSKGVLLKAGVAEANPDYDPMVPHSQAILITNPGRICFFDETKIELDCTKGGKGKGIRL